MSEDRPHLTLAAVDGEQTSPTDVGSDNLAAAARMFADMVDRGEFQASSAMLIAEVDGFVKLVCLGPSPSIVEAVGYLELTKERVIKGSFR